MKIPINWLKEFVDLPQSERDLTDKLTMAGHMLDKKTVVDGETVIDLELRGNRADCYSIYGIAREVSAIYGRKLKSPQVIDLKKGDVGINLEVKTPLVKRVGMIEIQNVAIKPSPKWLSQKLMAYGMDSINNIVDLTNYVMIETGEPMHAFDLDKIGTDLQIRLAVDGEKLTTFMGEVITLTDDDLVWAKGEQILSVAGAVGEKYNSISDSTKNVLLEAANYDRANIRRTVYRHKLLTDAGIRHEKELDPSMVETGIGRFLFLLKKNGWGNFKPIFYDYYPKKVLPKKLSLSLSLLENLGGLKMEKVEVVNILKRLSFIVNAANGDNLEIIVPTYRTDVVSAEDVIEEILRIYGYDKIPENVLSLSIPKNITPTYIKQEEEMRNNALALGFSEIISLSFVKKKLAKYNIHPESIGNEIISIINPPSPDNRDMRITLLPNLYEQAVRAINEREEETLLFEIGKVYMKSRNTFKEVRKMAFIYHEAVKEPFLKFKSLIDGFLEKSRLTDIQFSAEPINLPVNQSYKLVLNGKNVGYGAHIEENIYYLELDLDVLLEKQKTGKVKLWPKYPPQIEDITFSLPEKTKIGDLVTVIKSLDKRITKVELKDIYNSSYTFNIEYQDQTKTLANEDVSKIHSDIIKAVKSRFGVTEKS